MFAVMPRRMHRFPYDAYLSEWETNELSFAGHCAKPRHFETFKVEYSGLCCSEEVPAIPRIRQSYSTHSAVTVLPTRVLLGISLLWLLVSNLMITIFIQEHLRGSVHWLTTSNLFDAKTV